MMSHSSIRIIRTLACIFGFSFSTLNQAYSQNKNSDLAKEKQTTLGLYLTAKDAYEKWKADSLKIKILDVRTTEEYLFIGHAKMAYNVPVFFQTTNWDTLKHDFAMKPNLDFISQIKSVFKPTDSIFVMCRSGGRSAYAVNLLTKEGYFLVYNITDGMEGDVVKDAESIYKGQRMVNGWKNSGNPWSYEINPNQVIISTGKKSK